MSSNPKKFNKFRETVIGAENFFIKNISKLTLNVKSESSLL